MKSNRSPHVVFLLAPLVFSLGLAGCSDSDLPVAPHVGRIESPATSSQSASR